MTVLERKMQGQVYSAQSQVTAGTYALMMGTMGTLSHDLLTISGTMVAERHCSGPPSDPWTRI